MEQFIEFVGNHWILSSVWVVLFMLLIISYSKTSSKMIGVQEATMLLNREEAVVIDIRAKADYKKGHILGSVNIPTNQLDEGAKGLPKDKSKPLILVCHSGVTTASVAQKLHKLGYDNLHRLQGGITSWKGENLPLEKG
jgi:rhodanese-related sulfurtransferase